MSDDRTVDEPSVGTHSPRRHSPDAELVTRARQGDTDAFGELWNRHWRAGRAFSMSVSTLDPDDVVSEAFTRIFKALKSGSGPKGPGFRSYLYVVIKNTSAEWGRRSKEVAVEPGVFDLVEDETFGEQAVLAAFDRSLTAKAFSTLNPRYQEVLWYSEVERLTPSELAPILGMRPNAVAVLAFRAKESLRQAWIQAHIQSVEPGTEHHWVVRQAGAYTRGKLAAPNAARVEGHIDECSPCALVIAEARDVGGHLRTILPLALLGAGAGSAYFLSSSPAPASAAATSSHPPAGSWGHRITAKKIALTAAAVAAAGALALGGLEWSSISSNQQHRIATETAPSSPSATDQPHGGAVPPAPAQVPTATPAPTPGASRQPVANQPLPTPAPAAALTTVAPVPVALTNADTGSTGLVYPIVSGTAAPGASVEIAGPLGVLATVNADASGKWSSPVLSSLLPGQQIITATAAGTTARLSVTVSTPPAIGYTATASGFYLLLSGIPGALVAIHGDAQTISWGTRTLGADGSAQIWLPWSISGTHTIAATYVDGDRTGAPVTASLTLPGITNDPPN